MKPSKASTAAYLGKPPPPLHTGADEPALQAFRDCSAGPSSEPRDVIVKRWWHQVAQTTPALIVLWEVFEEGRRDQLAVIRPTRPKRRLEDVQDTGDGIVFRVSGVALGKPARNVSHEHARWQQAVVIVQVFLQYR